MIALYAHGGSENHGCEALVRSTISFLDTDVTLFSSAIGEDFEYEIERIVTLKDIEDCPPKKPSLRYYLSAVEIKLSGTEKLFTRFRYNKMLSQANKGDVFFSIGGDNYCYGGSEQLSNLNYWLHKKGVKTVLWGCSIEPTSLTPPIVEDMKRYNLITVRESLTLEALQEKGIIENVLPCVDTAFLLRKEELPLPELFIPGRTIGVNVSPLITKLVDNDLVIRNYVKMIQHIIDTTDYQIMLVPHVVTPKSDDRIELVKLLNQFQDTQRIFMINDFNCMQLKGYIARCELFVGARTHATIAAYSSCVPTLAVGYSIKASGIATDLFGTDKNYVVPVQSLKSENDLTQSFDWLSDHQLEIRRQLKSKMGHYTDSLKPVKKKIGEILEH